MRLMPPTKADLAVDHAQLLVQAAQLARLQPGSTSGRAGGTPPARTPARGSSSRSSAACASEPKPSTTTRTRTPRRAGVGQRVGHARPAASSWKM